MDPIQNQPQPSPVPQAPNNVQKKVGPIIATLIIVLILIIAALYMFASRLNQQAVPTDDMTDLGTTTQTVQPITGKSDDINSIQTDLNASTNGVDQQNL
jgi:hypothetical protein